MNLKASAIFAVTLLIAVVLVACGGRSTNEENATKTSRTQNIKKLVNEYSVGNIRKPIRLNHFSTTHCHRKQQKPASL